MQSPSHCPSVSGHLSILISPCCPSQPLSLTHTQSPSLLSLSPSLNRYVIYWGATIRKIITWWSECHKNYYQHSETSNMAPDSRIYPEWARQLDAHPATAELFIDHSNFCCGLKLFVRSKKLQFPSLTELTDVVKTYSGTLLEQYLQRGNGFLPPSAIYYYIYWCLKSPPLHLGLAGRPKPKITLSGRTLCLGQENHVCNQLAKAWEGVCKEKAVYLKNIITTLTPVDL